MHVIVSPTDPCHCGAAEKETCTLALLKLLYCPAVVGWGWRVGCKGGGEGHVSMRGARNND